MATEARQIGEIVEVDAFDWDEAHDIADAMLDERRALMGEALGEAIDEEIRRVFGVGSNRQRDNIISL